MVLCMENMSITIEIELALKPHGVNVPLKKICDL